MRSSTGESVGPLIGQ